MARTSHDDQTAAEVRAATERWIQRHESPWGRVVALASNASRRALAPLTDQPMVRRVLDASAERILDRADFAGQVDHAHADRLRELEEPVQRLRFAAARSAEIRRQHRLVLGMQTSLTGAASVVPVAAAASFAGDIALVSVGLLHVASSVLSAYGVEADELPRLAVGTVLLSTERDADARRDGLASLAGPASSSGSTGEVVGAQTGPRLAVDAVESLVRRLAGRRAAGAAPLVGAVAGAASTIWMVDAVAATAARVGAHRLLGLDVDPAAQ